jgi:hypothetical protein
MSGGMALVRLCATLQSTGPDSSYYACQVLSASTTSVSVCVCARAVCACIRVYGQRVCPCALDLAGCHCLAAAKHSGALHWAVWSCGRGLRLASGGLDVGIGRDRYVCINKARAQWQGDSRWGR